MAGLVFIDPSFAAKARSMRDTNRHVYLYLV
jgi:hypothetical protein